MHPLRFCAERPVLIGELNPFSYVLTREQVAFDRAGRKILPARPKTTCSRNLKGKKIYPFFAVRVTSTASGGQKRRTGANREVPSPAETCTGTSP